MNTAIWKLIAALPWIVNERHFIFFYGPYNQQAKYTFPEEQQNHIGQSNNRAYPSFFLYFPDDVIIFSYSDILSCQRVVNVKCYTSTRAIWGKHLLAVF